MASQNSESPPRNQVPSSHESPAQAKRVHHSRSYQSGFLDEARLAVLEDLGHHIPQITLQDFLDFLAPPQPEFNIEATMERLNAYPNGILTSSGRWKAFDTEPKDQLGGEDLIFKPMQRIFKNVVDAIIANSNLTVADRSVDFLQNPTMVPTSAEWHNSTRPDGYMVVKNSMEGIVSWSDILLSCEYKRKDGVEDLNDDVRKCVWSMQHIMRDDPCRRATFGMTIENATTRLWFCCRSSVIVSNAFDFIADPRLLVKIFAAFAFADRKSLGLDPTVERVPGKPMQFIITVHPDDDKNRPRRFCTRKIISSYGAEPLRGRGTRVFEAIEIDERGNNKGSAVVLKDIWIDHDRAREGSILAQIREDADEEDKKMVKKHFLTTVCHGDVWIEPDVIDGTREGLMRGLKIPVDTFVLQNNLVIPRRDAATGSEALHATSRVNIRHPSLKYSHKTHYRIVFEEKGITIDLVERLPDVMTILSETVTALQLLRKLGWVHRDVSIGNILSYEGGAKLADLEYAKKAGETTSHDMRTGTLHFMSVEMSAHMFLFDREIDEFDETLDEEEQEPHTQDVMSATQSDEVAEAPFAYNHLHDLESLWWVAVWIVFNNDFRNPHQSNEEPLSNLQEVESQLRLCQTLFPSIMASSGRQNAFSKAFPKIFRDLPANKKVVCRRLDTLRKYLVRHYVKVESTLPHSIDLTASKDDIYENFRKVFMRSQGSYSGVLLAFIPDTHAKLRRSLKRPRAETTDESGGITQMRRE